MGGGNGCWVEWNQLGGRIRLFAAHQAQGGGGSGKRAQRQFQVQLQRQLLAVRTAVGMPGRYKPVGEPLDRSDCQH